MKKSQFTYRHRVQFSETDSAGIVHFSNFFRYMEMAEHAFFRSLGFSIHDRHAAVRTGWPRVEATCEYRKPLYFEDEIDIQLLIAEKRRKSIRYQFRIWQITSQERHLVALGYLTTVAVQLSDRPAGMQAVLLPAAVDEATTTASAEALADPGR